MPPYPPFRRPCMFNRGASVTNFMFLYQRASRFNNPGTFTHLDLCFEKVYARVSFFMGFVFVCRADGVSKNWIEIIHTWCFHGTVFVSNSAKI